MALYERSLLHWRTPCLRVAKRDVPLDCIVLRCAVLCFSFLSVRRLGAVNSTRSICSFGFSEKRVGVRLGGRADVRSMRQSHTRCDCHLLQPNRGKRGGQLCTSRAPLPGLTPEHFCLPACQFDRAAESRGALLSQFTYAGSTLTAAAHSTQPWATPAPYQPQPLPKHDALSSLRDALSKLGSDG